MAASIQELYAAACAAYHDLMVGCLPMVVVDQNGERVEYNRASAGRLAAYIRSLELSLAGKTRMSTVNFCTSKGL